MTLMHIRLELARTPEFPEGSSEHGYEFLAPLDEAGHIDPVAWKRWKDSCKVIRFWDKEEPQHGRLRHVGKGWRFDYDASDDVDDEPFFKLGGHSLLPGNYVSITEHDGVQRPFRVVTVTPSVRRVQALG
jgi:hypothetical protein